jgi:preprotein translocase subunit Sss1
MPLAVTKQEKIVLALLAGLILLGLIGMLVL